MCGCTLDDQKAKALDYIQLGSEVVLTIVRPNAKEVEWIMTNEGAN